MSSRSAANLRLEAPLRRSRIGHEFAQRTAPGLATRVAPAVGAPAVEPAVRALAQNLNSSEQTPRRTACGGRSLPPHSQPDLSCSVAVLPRRLQSRINVRLDGDISQSKATAHSHPIPPLARRHLPAPEPMVVFNRTSTSRSSARQRTRSQSPWTRHPNLARFCSNHPLIHPLRKLRRILLALAVSVNQIRGDISGQQGELEELFHHIDHAVVEGGRPHAT